ncbi:efflux transporter periplasmic adaptor subunit, partial [Rhizobium ruizarguesonis]
MARKPIGILGASTLFAAALAASTAFSQETPVAKPQQNLPAIVV